jgi:hypothetical protein
MVLLPSLRDGETATKRAGVECALGAAAESVCMVEKERDLASVLRATTNGE